MFKNSKMLRGIVLALALVLVLGGGLVLKMHVGAEANTVVLYVSANGNNTTGADAATAFTTIAAATKAANDRSLAPGTEVKIVVLGDLYVTSRNLDGATAKDSAGGKLHFTITSEKTGSVEEYSTLLHHAFSSSGSTSYEKIILSNDITFRNVIISAEAQPYYQSNAPLDDPIKPDKLYRTRYLHAGANNIVFDGCVITTTIPDMSEGWVFCCDAYASSTVEATSTLTMLNGDYSNVTVYVQDQVTPLWDLKLYVENSTIGTVYADPDTDQAASVNAKSIDVFFKNSTVSSYRPQGRGQIAVTHGITATFEDT
ncbi:MAG: hypothetical protein IJC26_01715, partial [Clostridia bacterium]|nr:hypothetical protein [Clostridia bacterium]